jgi:single-strand DNA-binding protein
MGNYNRVILIGNLVRDPEIRYVQSGSPVAKFTIAVNRRTKQDGAADYIDIVAWDKLAETSNSYLKKGMPVLVEGRLAIRSYESKSGEKHKAAEVVMSLMQMLSGFGAKVGAGDDPIETSRGTADMTGS